MTHIMNKIYPIFADGPLKGCQLELPVDYLARGYVMREMSDVYVTDFLDGLPSSALPKFDETHYMFHMFRIFRHVMIIGSEKYRAEDIDTDVVLHLLLSPAAKKAMWK